LFENNYAHVKSGQWCPICAAGLNERICRAIFEKLFLQKFSKERPKWLVGIRGFRLELDGYCREVGLAFEYQGEQHYKEIKHFYRNKINGLDARIDSDKLKREMCKLNKVALIEIPFSVKPKDMRDYILNACIRHGFVPPNKEPFDVFELEVVAKSRIAEMHELAKDRGWKCLSNNFVGSHSKLKWQCSVGHTFEQEPALLRSGYGYPVHPAVPEPHVEIHYSGLGTPIVLESPFHNRNRLCRAPVYFRLLALRI